jgi:hypothetical protein
MAARGITSRQLYVSLAAVGGLLLLLGRLLNERTPVSKPLVGLLAGC